MKGTVFAVALNHQSQRVAWAEAFEKAPYNAPPKRRCGLSSHITLLSAQANRFPSRREKPC